MSSVGLFGFCCYLSERVVEIVRTRAATDTRRQTLNKKNSDFRCCFVINGRARVIIIIELWMRDRTNS